MKIIIPTNKDIKHVLHCGLRFLSLKSEYYFKYCNYMKH